MGFEQEKCWGHISGSVLSAVDKTQPQCRVCGQTRKWTLAGYCTSRIFPPFSLADLMCRLDWSLRVEYESLHKSFLIMHPETGAHWRTYDPLESLCRYLMNSEHTMGGHPLPNRDECVKIAKSAFGMWDGRDDEFIRCWENSCAACNQFHRPSAVCPPADELAAWDALSDEAMVSFEEGLGGMLAQLVGKMRLAARGIGEALAGKPYG